MAHDETWPQRRKWSTTFWVNTSAAITAAASIAGSWVAYLHAACRNNVFAYEVYATDTNPVTEDFAIVPIAPSNQRGTITAASSQKYLAKACINQRLNVASSRPSFKFWRPGLLEEDVVDGVTLTSGWAAALDTAFSSMIEDFEGTLVDPDGQVIGTVGKRTLSTREFGRYAGNDLPVPPASG